MAVNKHGVTIDCANCRFIKSGGSDNFEVVVPISDDETDTGGLARLHCRVSSHAHDVELAAWQAPGVPTVEVGGELDRRLASALAFVAEKRLCGNRGLCPAEVVNLVAKNGPG